MGDVTLERYQAEERQLAMTEAHRGLRVHAAVTVVVCVGLVLLNIFVASEFPWAVFPVLGMSLGVWFHWYFGVRHGDELMQRHQQEIESSAHHRLAA